MASEPRLIHAFIEGVRAPGGTLYAAQVLGRARQDGMWEGWLEFTDEHGQRRRTPRETTQSSVEDLEYWASGIEPLYLEGALERALRHA